jgi:outer membrane protein, heavy metal efflux system
MRSRTIRWFLASGVIAGCSALEAKGQAPTLGTELPQSPGSNTSVFGPTPGSGGGTFASPAVGGGQILGGRPGTAAPRVPTSISTPGLGGNALAPTTVPAIPPVAPLTEVPLYGTLELPSGPEDGPPDGLTFDQALEWMLRENLDLRARRIEIPSAKADVITAGLRGNPIFYADSQLNPYGAYSLKRQGGPNQYDVNISQPIDFSRKRIARLAVANSTLRAVEFQYQESVRVQINNLAVAYNGVVSARETLRYVEAGLKGIDRVLDATRRLQQFSDKTSGDVLLLEAQRGSAEVGVMDAREGLRKAKLALGSYLNLPPIQAESIEILAPLKPIEPPIPPGEELAQWALSCRPDVLAYREGIKVAKASLGLQERNRFADAYLLLQPYTFQNLSYFPDSHSATSWAVGITVPLPVFNRNQGNIARAKLNIEQSHLQLRAVERLAVEQVRDAEMEYLRTKRFLEDLERNAIPKVRKAMQVAERLYLAGETPNVTSYLAVQKYYNDAVRQYRDTAVRHRRSMSALNTAVGSRILP